MFASRTNWNFAENRLTQALAEHRRNGHALIDLTLSNPTEAGFTYDQPTILSALQNRASLQYEPAPQGLRSAREAVAQYYAEKKSPVSTEDIFLTTSTSEAYSYIFRMLCNPGDEVLIPTPGYPLFDFLADLNDVRLVRYPLVYDHGWQIDFPSLERAITPLTRAVVIVNPNNPTGHYAKPQEQSQLASICEKNNLAIIADEVFLDFSVDGTVGTTFAAQNTALTFSLSGLSKICGLPQMKSAWIAISGPEESKQEARKRLEIIADSYLSMNAPVQHALPRLLATRKQFQAQLLDRVRTNLVALDDRLSAQAVCSRLVCEAGWNVILRVPATRSDEDLALELLQKQGVFVHPGHFYDFPQDGYLVLGLIAPKMDFAEGTRRLLEFFSN
ncbi:MAG TPA: pyridoxal phosphate-dependent aminotransferase [Candidatus Dormibacteraeota bacterium]|nr:pyridoxal phosphate-dependent aminotransferase [Candidatus Dormibacteraeota bacterium]